MENKNNHNEEDQLKKEAPFLFGISKAEPYEAPDGYFEKFNRELTQKISSEKSSPWYYFLFRKVVYVPAMVVILITSIFLFRTGTETDFSFTAEIPVTNVTLEQASFASLDYYVETHLLASLNTHEIVDMVGRNEIPDLGIKVKEETVTPAIEHIEEEDMEEYILDNIDDFDMNEIY